MDSPVSMATAFIQMLNPCLGKNVLFFFGTTFGLRVVTKECKKQSAHHL